MSLSLSQSPHKQSGFTLIELMVVMAIIAILATAGLSAYTGYLKKARDAVRIADINAINKIVLGSMGSTGMPPDITTLRTAIMEANNGVLLRDPISAYSCLGPTGVINSGWCVYFYSLCNDGTGYDIGIRFESISNLSLYLGDIGRHGGLYEIGSSCTSLDGIWLNI